MPWLSVAILLNQTTSDADLRSLVARIDHLQPAQLRRLTSYGHRAFREIYPIVDRRLRISLRQPSNSDARLASELKLQTAVRTLCAVSGPEETSTLARLEARLPELAQVFVVNWLCKTGKPSVAVLARIVRRSNPRLAFVDARAVPLLVKVDPTAAERVLLPLFNSNQTRTEIRRSTYCYLARLNSKTANRALAKFRDGGEATLPDLAKRKPLPTRARWPGWVKGTRGDFGLVIWGALGNGYSLWIMKRTKEGWSEPVFTGRSIAANSQDEHQPDAQMKAYCSDGLWLDDLVWLRKDADNDGYTDVVEDWLGTDRDNPDTDGDGLRDGIDKNPTAGNPPRSDAQGVVMAAMCAQAFGETDLPLIVNLPPQISPFSYNRWPRLVRFPNEKTRADSLYGLHISVGTPLFSGSRSASVEIKESGSWYDLVVRYRVIKTDNGWLVSDAEVLSSAMS